MEVIKSHEKSDYSCKWLKVAIFEVNSAGTCTVERCQTCSVNAAEIQNRFKQGNIIINLVSN